MSALKGYMGAVALAAVVVAGCSGGEAQEATGAAGGEPVVRIINVQTIQVDPREFTEFIESSPAIVENCFSSGVATAAAIESGFAPGSDACTWMVGKSTVGRSLTGRLR